MKYFLMIVLLSITLSCSSVKKPINNPEPSGPISPCDDPNYDKELQRLLCN